MTSLKGAERVGLIASEGQAVPLVGVEVEAEVVGGHVRSIVRQRYKNTEAKAIEAIYTFPLPSRAAITGFSMTVDGRRLEGEVQEREQAFRTYDDAITAGHGAALVEQERPNVFTANVGNLLPGEETVIAVETVEPLVADEGAVRYCLPTLVAPRYIPGNLAGDRTAHGIAAPTDRVPDADRISPPIGNVAYGLSLSLVFDLGVALDVESPSHAVVATVEGAKTRVTFAQKDVGLDRDVVVTAYPRAAANEAAPIASSVAHRAAGKPGTVAITLVPDLRAGEARRNRRSDVVFVLDRSGSMDGASMPEARTALKLCLRQLREGDRFAILAFDDRVETFAPQLVPFTQSTLARADAWLDSVDARGGTELLEPLLGAANLAPDGVIVLLTDGQVGNEDEILAAFMKTRKTARVYPFGIGTNVSDALLTGLADKTGGALVSIHPGERVDEKVVAQFARATAPRVTDLAFRFRGVEIAELAPAEPAALVDGEPFAIFGTYEVEGQGALEIRGRLDGEAFFMEVPVDLPKESDKPTVAKLWAKSRIVDLERAIVTGRRADTMRDRIVRLAKEYGVSSKYTSFVVVEKRTGDRLVATQAETRVVPVAPPAGWGMFGTAGAGPARRAPMMASALPPPPAMAPAPAPMAIGGAPPPRPSRAMAPAPGAPAARPMTASVASAPAASSGGMEKKKSLAKELLAAPAAAVRAVANAVRGGGGGDAADRDLGASFDAVAPKGGVAAKAATEGGAREESFASFAPAECEADAAVAEYAPAAFDASASESEDDARPTGRPQPLDASTILARQSASGLWEEAGRDPIEATAFALTSLLPFGINTSHAMYGAQIKKAIEALLDRVAAASSFDPKILALALGAAWLLASGRRTRGAVEAAARTHAGIAGVDVLVAAFGREDEMRAHVDRLAVV